MSRIPFLLFGVAAVTVPMQAAFAADRPTAQQLEFFEKKIRPVLIARCYKCHSAKAKKVKGALLLDTRAGLRKGGDSGSIVQPGNPKKSLLIRALNYDGTEMPPSGKLPQRVIADFEAWVRMGVPDPRDGPATAAKKPEVDYRLGLKFWAFQPPKNPPLPAVKNTAWPQRDLDRFVIARLQTASLKPSPPAAKQVLIRRAYFDLIGLPPTAQEVAAFLQDDSADAFVRVVDRLLKSPHYGERWGRRWLDVARFGEDQAHTFKARRYPRGYLYRDWVVKALNDDMPYNRFVMEQIAGDLLPGPKKHERLAALGFFALGPVYYQDNGEKAIALADEWDDRIDTLTRGLLGLTVSCARCHDHKFDPISMQDYYGLAGIFSSSQYQERPIASAEAVLKKQRADQAVKQQQLKIDRFLAVESRNVRPRLSADIPRYLTAAWKILNQQKSRKRDRRRIRKIARTEKLSEFLLNRWVKYLKSKTVRTRPHWAEWRKLIDAQDPKRDLSKDRKAIAAVHRVGERLRQRLESKLSARGRLFELFGENVAFVSSANRAVVRAGVIPLGNLFDDEAGTSLHAAVSSDRFKAAASSRSLGVDRVVSGWGNVATIAPGIRFDFRQLGSDAAKYGSVTNDSWNTQGGIRTQGRRLSGAAKRRMEQGIGMHANALITFDLAEIRKAGLMPANQKFILRIDRAGLNDDVFGSAAASAHLAVIVSGEQKKNEVYDAIISGSVNGRAVKVSENDRVYYFDGKIPQPLKADGRFVSFTIPVPARAKYLTLISTAAADDKDSNSINGDHTVFSGARLERDPPFQSNARQQQTPAKRKTATAADKADALLLSEFLSDKGLLALPGKDAIAKLAGAEKSAHSRLKSELAKLKKTAQSSTLLKAHSLTDGRGKNLRIFLRGNPKKPGAIAPRGFLPILTRGVRKPFSTSGSGRLELARAIVHKDNPLTARVIVNRVWQGHFGQGLVRTPSNFGALGERPTHPQLLDHLVHRFINSGWSLKSLHREIMLSATYRQSSRFDRAPYAVDPGNRLLWRMNRRRLEVEPWRDAMLAVAGRLDLALGGPSSRLSKANNRRRTLYGFVSRHQLNDLLRLFDFPDPNITSAHRTVTTVPLQQLFVLNSEFMVTQAKALAARLTKNPKEADAQRIQRAYLLLYSRPANGKDVALGRAFLQAVSATGGGKTDSLTAWEQYALALLGANEFMFLD